MIQSYTAVSGQSLLDVCLITYGSMDYIVKLANDNGITDLCTYQLSGKVFTFDSSLVVNQVIASQLNNKYGTGANLLQYYGTEDGDGYYADESGNIYIPE